MSEPNTATTPLDPHEIVKVVIFTNKGNYTLDTSKSGRDENGYADLIKNIGKPSQFNTKYGGDQVFDALVAQCVPVVRAADANENRANGQEDGGDAAKPHGQWPPPIPGVDAAASPT